jgi:hypothetical protein
VLNGEHWLEASEKIVSCIVQSEKLLIREARLFQFLIDWANAKSEDGRDQLFHIADHIKHVRFATMSKNEFSNLCANNIPLSYEEKFKIMRSISTFENRFLPDNFSHSSWPRHLSRNFHCTSLEYLRKGSVNYTFEINTTATHNMLTFSVRNDNIYLDGLDIKRLAEGNTNCNFELEIEVRSPEMPLTKDNTVKFESVTEHHDNRIMLTHPVLLKVGIYYTVTITFKTGSHPLYVPKFESETNVLNITASSSKLPTEKLDVQGHFLDTFFFFIFSIL